jgi:hypothetical protein
MRHEPFRAMLDGIRLVADASEDAERASRSEVRAAVPSAASATRQPHAQPAPNASGERSSRSAVLADGKPPGRIDRRTAGNTGPHRRSPTQAERCV